MKLTLSFALQMRRFARSRYRNVNAKNSFSGNCSFNTSDWRSIGSESIFIEQIANRLMFS
ncbi:hypothetical protein [Myxosarcina sp. GI1]|uniref:hypothetical protein n=1 Tax=Myxosarcina sp. GI1 TaxID=1541065 RepID=UPI0012E0A2DC|nr:hypothetical protein [Myxosarcina sp. GI1]